MTGSSSRTLDSRSTNEQSPDTTAEENEEGLNRLGVVAAVVGN
jgi:hypothetical protein